MRPRIHKKAAAPNLVLPEALKKAAQKYALALGLHGGLSELVSRLLTAELAKKNDRTTDHMDAILKQTPERDHRAAERCKEIVRERIIPSFQALDRFAGLVGQLQRDVHSLQLQAAGRATSDGDPQHGRESGLPSERLPATGTEPTLPQGPEYGLQGKVAQPSTQQPLPQDSTQGASTPDTEEKQ